MNNKGLLKKLAAATILSGVSGGLVTLGAARYMVDKLTRYRAPGSDEFFTFTPFETQVDYESVQFPTRNNRMLEGWWLPRPNTRRAVICVSGYRGKKEDMLGISSYLWRKGYNVLLFDFRAHGINRLQEEMATLGHTELEDMQAAIGYVRQRMEKPLIALLGGSMGAAVCLVAGARDPEIKAVWADSAFTSQHFVISYTWKNVTKVPPYPVVPLAERIFAHHTGYKWQDFAPINEVAKLANRPVFFVHGTGDVTVPVECAYQLYNAKPGWKQLWIEEGVGHCGIYFKYREEYSQRVLNFLEQNLVDEPVIFRQEREKVAKVEATL